MMYPHPSRTPLIEKSTLKDKKVNIMKQPTLPSGYGVLHADDG